MPQRYYIQMKEDMLNKNKNITILQYEEHKRGKRISTSQAQGKTRISQGKTRISQGKTRISQGKTRISQGKTRISQGKNESHRGKKKSSTREKININIPCID
eukprot:358765_1